LTAVGVLATAALAAPVQATPPQATSLDPAGPAQTVFDWSTDACDPNNIPDLPARAFRDDQGRVQLVMSHFTNRRLIGPSLDQLGVDCGVILSSAGDANPATFNDRQWIASLFTGNGKNVTALVHEEYEGSTHPGHCPQASYMPCWYNAITFARSTDGGDTFIQPALPRRLVAGVPYTYVAGAGPYGLFEPSNIVRNPADGYFYVVMMAQDYLAQQTGTCVMRTQTPGDPTSWRAWDGAGFSVQFADPFAASLVPDAHVCAPVSYPSVATMHESLTWNTYLKRFLLVGVAQRGPTPGIYFSTSTDLINWSQAKLVTAAELPWTFACGGPDPVLYPSLIDPASTSRMFSTSGRSPFLYYTQFHYTDCRQSLDRDLVRVPLRISAG
jgi:hypothetical protein